MDKHHKEVLRKNRVYLVDNLMLEQLIPYLVTYSVFTDDMIEHIQAAGISSARKQRLLTDLTRRGPNAYSLFLNSLQDSGQGYIADQLKYTERGNIGIMPHATQSSRPIIQPGHMMRTRGQSATLHVPTPVQPVEETTGQHNVPMEQSERGCRLSQASDDDKMNGCEGVGDARIRHVQETAVNQRINHSTGGTAHLYDAYRPYIQAAGIEETQGHMSLPVRPTQVTREPRDPTKVYKMDKTPSGFCLIINNKNFISAQLGERLGTDIDCDNLQTLFRELCFQVMVENNLTAEEIRQSVCKFSQNRCHSHSDACVVALLTHGTNGGLLGTDGETVPIEKLLTYFNASQCHSLQGKPKMFIVQACRGCDMDVPDTFPVNPTQDISSQLIESMSELNVREIDKIRHRLPEGTDMLVAYATIPGFVSWRNTERGSWFIQAIFEVFSKEADSEDVLSMMTMVNDKVAMVYESKHGSKQCPSPVTTLRKKWFFQQRQ